MTTPMIPRPLTPRQRLLLRYSGQDPKDGQGYGVPLRGSADWRTARSLQTRDLGWIEGGRPNGSDFEGLFFANADGIAAITPEPEDNDE